MRDAHTHTHTQPVVGKEPRNAHIIKDDLHTTGKISELGMGYEVRARGGREGAPTVQAKAKVLSSNPARQPANRPCAAVCQVVIRCRHHCIRTSVRVGGRFGGRVEAFCPSTVILARTRSLVRKLDG